MGVMIVLATAGLQLGAAATAAHRARTAADLSALAGATTLQKDGGEPCAVVTDVAARNGSEVLSCALGVGESVTVRVSVDVASRWPGVPDLAIASARAGPGDAQPSNPQSSTPP